MNEKRKKEWDAIERGQGSGTVRRYRSTVCLLCGRTISEGAWSGADGNFKRHVAACERKRKENK